MSAMRLSINDTINCIGYNWTLDNGFMHMSSANCRGIGRMDITSKRSEFRLSTTQSWDLGDFQGVTTGIACGTKANGKVSIMCITVLWPMGSALESFFNTNVGRHWIYCERHC